MVHDPLHTPLKPRSWRERMQLRASPAMMAMSIMLVAAASLLAWAWMQPAPPPSATVAERELPPRPSVETRPRTDEADTNLLEESIPATTPHDEKVDANAAPSARKARKKGSRIISVTDLPDEPVRQGKERAANFGMVLEMPGAAAPLPPAPVPGLVEKTSFGPLPRQSAKGRKPWKAYARPVNMGRLAAPGPKLAILVTGLLPDTVLADTAVRTLPSDVSLAFRPFGSKLPRRTRQARRNGHEFFLQVAMEPWGYPSVNPGPDTLLTTAPPKQNLARLWRVMGSTVGYVGITTLAGQKMLQNGEALSPILHDLNRRGLMVVDDGSAGRSLLPDLAQVMNLPALRASVHVPASASAKEAEKLFARARDQAREQGRALLVVAASASNLRALRQWLDALAVENTRLQLLPVSALAR